jgi:hypothetical protein
MMDLIASVDDASKPYDGPMTFVKPTLQMSMNDSAHDREDRRAAKGAFYVLAV